MPVFIGMQNFDTAFHDPVFWTSLKVTFVFALISLPLMTVLAIAVAILLNQKIIADEFFKVVFYLPTVIPIVASSVLWAWIFKADNGILNQFLGFLNIDQPKNYKGWQDKFLGTDKLPYSQILC